VGHAAPCFIAIFISLHLQTALQRWMDLCTIFKLTGLGLASDPSIVYRVAYLTHGAE
jgi:hypothetical protein